MKNQDFLVSSDSYNFWGLIIRIQFQKIEILSKLVDLIWGNKILKNLSIYVKLTTHFNNFQILSTVKEGISVHSQQKVRFREYIGHCLMG